MNIWHENTETPTNDSWCHIVFKKSGSTDLINAEFKDGQFEWWFNGPREVKLEDVKKWAYSDELIESVLKGEKNNV